jgi:hypothetical protein
MTSTIDSSIPPLTPTYPPNKPSLETESSQSRALITHLNLQPHIEGGYFVETDRDTRRVTNPFSTSSDTQTPLKNPIYHCLPSHLKPPTNSLSLPSQLFHRRLHPRRQHHYPLPPHARLAAGSFPPQSRAHSTHSAQRPRAVRDHPRGRSRSEQSTRRLRRNRRRRKWVRREEVVDWQGESGDVYRWAGCAGRRETSVDCRGWEI